MARFTHWTESHMKMARFTIWSDVHPILSARNTVSTGIGDGRGSIQIYGSDTIDNGSVGDGGRGGEVIIFVHCSGILGQDEGMVGRKVGRRVGNLSVGLEEMV